MHRPHGVGVCRRLAVEPLEQRALLANYYVAPGGADANPGTLELPLATIQRGADLAQPGDVVWIRGGTYRETVTPRRSGLANAPIIFRAYAGETVTIDGADAISADAWSLWGGNIYQAAMPWTLGDGDQVFVDGQMVNYARWPNTTLDVSNPVLAKADSATYTLNGASSTGTFNDADLTQAAGFFNGATISTALGAVWVTQQGVVTSSQAGKLTFTYSDMGSSYLPTAGNHYYLTGKFNLLDTAGEWFRDAGTGTLYVWTPDGASPASHTVEAKARPYAFDLSNRAYIRVEGLKLFASTITTSDASHHIVIDGVDAQYVSHYSQITSAWGQGISDTGILLRGNYNELLNSTIAYSAGNGVMISGNHIQVFNNVVHDVDYMAGDSAAIDASALTPTDVDISYNTLYNTGRSGLLHRTIRQSRILHNEIYNVGLQMKDLGITYAWGSNGQGTEIAYNLVHDNLAAGNATGIYLDNGCSNYIVHHNVSWNDDFALQVNTPGNFHKLYNNTLVGRVRSVAAWPFPGDESGTEFRNNIFTGSTQIDATAAKSNNLPSTTSPQFVDAAHSNYQLQATSPARDAGLVLSPYTDGYMGAAPDEGAYEFGAPVWTAGAGKNHQPVLDAGVSPAFPTVAENSTTHLGLLVTELLALSAGGSPISDADPDAVRGIAVIGCDNAGGRWEFSLDNGTTWTAFGVPTDSNARLLAADSRTRIRYVPVTSTGVTTLNVYFRAWDRTLGANGGQGSAIVSGSNSPFSAAVEPATASFAPQNKPPALIAGAIANTQVLDTGITSLGLGWLAFSPGGPDELGQTLACTISTVPDPARGSIVRAGDLVPLVVGQTISLADLRGLRFSAASGSTSCTGQFSFTVSDNGTTNGQPDPKSVSFTLPLEIVHRRAINSLGDLETVPDSSDPASFVEVSGIAYFTASDPVHGNELWRSDATAAGTWIVKDIWPGTRGSSISGLLNINGTLYFSANDGANGQELWKSDGTAAGTAMVKDIAPYSANGTPNSSSPANLTNVNGILFFSAKNIVDLLNNHQGIELWCSDGTSEGTTMVKDIYPSGGSSSPARLTPIGNTVYFTATDGVNGTELWRSDGSSAGTVMVKDLTPGGGSTISAMAAVGNTLLFAFTDANSGTELWKSDGTAAGTAIVKDIVPDGGSSNPANFTVIGSTLFFTATDGSGTELWKSDSTPTGTTVVVDINPGAGSSSPANLTNVGGMLFFAATDGSKGVELWKSDGTAANTVLVKDININSANSSPANLTNVGGTLFFTANDGTHGAELWKSNGAAAGTTLVDDLGAASGSGSYANLAAIGNRLFFRGSPTTTDRQPWTSDGTSAGTAMIMDITQGATATSNPSSPTSLGGNVYFFATTMAAGTELWKSDGTLSGTAILKDINPGLASAGAANLRLAAGQLYFSANNGTVGSEPWTSDGTATGTTLLKDINPGGNSSPSNFTAVGSTVFFTANDGTNGSELWRTDGNAANTALVKDLTSGNGGSSLGNFTSYGGLLLFTFNDGTTGTELWRSDGTATGTWQVKDINPGAGSSSPSSLTVFNGYVCFSANNGTTGAELWRTDGTTAGTTLVCDIYAGSGSSTPSGMAVLGNLLLFNAASAVGRELWKTDGTTAGTVQVIDPELGRGLDPTGLTAWAGTAYFISTTGAAGTELWKTDGTTAGTMLLKDIRPGGDSSWPSAFTIMGNRLFFRADDGVHGAELWQTDGTSAGTMLPGDLIPGSVDPYPQFLTAWNSMLFFRATDGLLGEEMWTYADSPPTTSGIADVKAWSIDPNTRIDLFAAFQDDVQLDSALNYAVTADSNPSLFTSIAIDSASDSLVLDYDPAVSGTASVTIRATDAAGQFVETSFTVLVGVDLAPTNVALSSATVPENSPAGTPVGDFSTTDPNSGDTFTYTLLDGAGGRFKLVGSQVQVDNGALLDYEAATSHSITIRTADSGGLSLDKQLTIDLLDLPETLSAGPSDWPPAGLTLKLASGLVHLYQTGTTTDTVTPILASATSRVQITGRAGLADTLTIDFSGGNPLPSGGLTFDGGSAAGGDSVAVIGTAGNDNVTLSPTQVIVNGGPAVTYSNAEFFGFDLKTGTDSLTVDGTTLRLAAAGAISAGTNVTVTGGGTLMVADADALPAGTGLTIGGGGTVVLASDLPKAIELSSLNFTLAMTSAVNDAIPSGISAALAPSVTTAPVRLESDSAVVGDPEDACNVDRPAPASTAADSIVSPSTTGGGGTVVVDSTTVASTEDPRQLPYLDDTTDQPVDVPLSADILIVGAATWHPQAVPTAAPSPRPRVPSASLQIVSAAPSTLATSADRGTCMAINANPAKAYYVDMQPTSAGQSLAGLAWLTAFDELTTRRRSSHKDAWPNEALNDLLTRFWR